MPVTRIEIDRDILARSSHMVIGQEIDGKFYAFKFNDVELVEIPEVGVMPKECILNLKARDVVIDNFTKPKDGSSGIDQKLLDHILKAHNTTLGIVKNWVTGEEDGE